MSVSELFYQSALINAIVFLWLASAGSAARIFLRSERKIAFSLFLSGIFGPLALLVAWVNEGFSAKKLPKKKKFATKTLLTVIIASLLSIGSFHWFFVHEFVRLSTSSEVLILRIAFFLCVAGFLSGMFTAIMTKRVAFLESLWALCFFGLYLLSLNEWANEVFSYGTSMAYFSVLILCGSFLFLIFSTLGGALGYLFFSEGKISFRCGYEFFIGIRFLMTKRASQVVSLITVISVIAVMIACAGMIVVMSVMNGFSSDLRSKILGANPHLMVLKYGKDFSEYQEIVAKTKDLPGVLSASPFIINEGMISKDKNIAGALITGIADQKDQENQLLKYVDRTSLNYLSAPHTIPVINEVERGEDINNVLDRKPAINELPGIIIGKEMAKDLMIFLGDSVNVISPVGEIGPTGPIPKARAFRVAGFFESGMYEYDAKFAYIRLADAQDFFNLKGFVTGIEYRVSDIEKTREIAQGIESAIGGYPFYSRDWMQMNRNMFSALQLEKIAMLIILGTMIFMASLLILVTLIMVVMEKGKEIAILKSMGATDASVMKIFVTYGLFIGGCGALLGGSLGIAICVLIDKIGIRLDSDVYYFSKIPVKLESAEIFIVVIAAIIISFLATIPPSLFAARLKPVEGLRYE